MKLLSLLLVGVLFSSLMLVGVTLSDFPTDPSEVYSPWGDLNDDGIIDIFDIVWLAQRYDKSGLAVNKTELLYNVSDTLAEIRLEIDELKAENALLWSAIADRLRPDYDSGWFNMSKGDEVILQHNQSTTNVLVYMVGRMQDDTSPYIHHIGYGGQLNGLLRHGADWIDLTNTTIRVRRMKDDSYWEQIWVQMWRIG